MDKSKVEFIVKNNIEQLKKKLGLELWDIVFEYKSLDNDPGGSIASIDYKIATIVIDPACAKDEADVLHTLLHELIHCLMSTFNSFRQAAFCLIDAKETKDAIDVMYDRANEEVTMAFCRILEEQDGTRER